MVRHSGVVVAGARFLHRHRSGNNRQKAVSPLDIRGRFLLLGREKLIGRSFPFPPSAFRRCNRFSVFDGFPSCVRRIRVPPQLRLPPTPTPTSDPTPKVPPSEEELRGQVSSLKHYEESYLPDRTVEEVGIHVEESVAILPAQGLFFVGE